MFDCSACGHSEMVHTMFVGCCIVRSCSCLGMDGTAERCTPEAHVGHGQVTELPAPKTPLERLERLTGIEVTVRQRRKIIAMKHDGHGARTICGALSLPRKIVREVLIEEFGRGPAQTPRTRPRQEDWQRAMDAGIGHADYLAEREPGGRAETIDTLNAWIAEVAAG